MSRASIHSSKSRKSICMTLNPSLRLVTAYHAWGANSSVSKTAYSRTFHQVSLVQPSPSKIFKTSRQWKQASSSIISLFKILRRTVVPSISTLPSFLKSQAICSSRTRRCMIKVQNLDLVALSCMRATQRMSHMTALLLYWTIPLSLMRLLAKVEPSDTKMPTSLMKAYRAWKPLMIMDHLKQDVFFKTHSLPLWLRKSWPRLATFLRIIRHLMELTLHRSPTTYNMWCLQTNLAPRLILLRRWLRSQLANLSAWRWQS